MKLPIYFKNILWSYNLDDVDPIKMQKTIILNSLNYGKVEHLKWLKNFYGKEIFFNNINLLSDTELKPKTKRLIDKVFN